ncbi:uncharacterized protein [Porites lutea]|uniref:uncharacterized protein n=1 Tax=Porites lutea TaxID=51062 RepID=UPI003CC6A406
MKAFGGGWTLVVSISSKNNDYHQRPAINCWDSELCVPFNKDNMTTRKLSDEHIRHFASCEGTFRLDVFQGDYTVFYKIPQRSEQFDSACRGGNECPRLIISHHYPYTWETNNCTSLDVGYRIFLSSHYRVFDSHDDGECGALFISSLYESQRGLYGYTARDNNGIFLNKEGMLYVK